MTRQQIVFRQSQLDRRQPLLQAQHSSSRGGHRFAEVAGGTTAECAAVCCCCPCALMNFLVLAVYRVPAGLCRKALMKKRRRRLLKNGLLMQGGSMAGGVGFGSHSRSSYDGAEFSMHPAAAAAAAAERFVMKSMEADSDVIALEKEMWDKFYGTGFWRSPSQRVD